VEQLADTGDARARGVLAALRTLSFQLSGAQFGITLTSLIVGFLAEPTIATALRGPLETVVPARAVDAIAVATALLLATVATTVLGELVPQNLGIARPLPVARRTAGPHRAFSRVFRWVIAGLNGAANRIVRLLGVEPQEELRSARGPEELALLVAGSAEQGTLPSDTAALLTRSLDFGDKRADEVMTPRTRLVTLAADASVADLLRLARSSGHSRFPVLGRGVDDVTGVAEVTAGLRVPAGRRAGVPAGAIADPPLQVPDSLPLPDLLGRLRDGGAHLAVVVDEYGGVAGIVTFEDLLEELVGEVVDEYDDPVEEAPLGTDEAVVLSGLLRPHEVHEQIGLRLPDGPYETLAGFLLARLGHLPQPGERVECDGWTFVVAALDRRRVDLVTVLRPAEAAA
jgi:CBS domain containing-hemolysin-like protein